MTTLLHPRSRRYEKNRVPSQTSGEIVLIGALVSRNSTRECVNATWSNVPEIRRPVNLLGIRKAPGFTDHRSGNPGLDPADEALLLEEGLSSPEQERGTDAGHKAGLESCRQEMLVRNTEQEKRDA